MTISIDLQITVYILLYLLVGNFIAIIELYIYHIEKNDSLFFGERVALTFCEIIFWPLYLLTLLYMWSKGEI